MLKCSISFSDNTDAQSGYKTPVNQRSPPTPDITPPIAHSRTQMLPPSFNSADPSSRTESFKTARENQFSDDESRASDSPALLPSQQQIWLAATRRARLRDIGLGLDLASDEDDKTSGERTPRTSTDAHEFVTFDGSWDSETKGVKGDTEEARNSNSNPETSLRERGPRLPAISTRSPPKSLDLSMDATPTIMRGLSLRERVDRNKHSPTSASTERFAERIEWPLKEDDLDNDLNPQNWDNRRISQMSWTSTVVEAMVVDTPPQRKRTLRHIGKNPSLRAVSSPIDRSNRSSLVSDDPSHRLVHRNTRIPDRGNRRSTESDTSTSVNSSLARTRQESIPVIVIPERHSSLKSSATSSGRHSNGHSLTFARQHSSRPTTAPDDGVGYFDIMRTTRQSKPEVIPSTTPLTPKSIKIKDVVAAVPVYCAPLSAPISKNVSRATSITSVSARFREPGYSQSALPVPEPGDLRATGLDGVPMGDWSALRPRSSQVTPFSIQSVHSSTPGTLEVSEAQAVNLYPHNNRSILVVQQTARQDSETSPRSTIVTEQANTILEEPLTPPGASISRCLVDSPLRNPREPPRPPAFKVIPPTPANATPANDGEKQPDRRTPSSSRSRPLSMVRRAFSTRRYSDTFVTPFTRSLTRRNTTANGMLQTGEDPTAKLSPFWRPRGFWDDISDSDSEFGNDAFLVSNSLGMPQKSVVPGPSFLGRRLGSFRLRGPPQHGGMRRKHSVESTPAYEFTREENMMPRMPRLGYQVQFVGFKDLQDRFEKRKERKVEEKKERERARLRQSIGPVIAHPHARLA
ncbi:MAG: hypothetical protein LQ347_006406 [Umbilicaria vellea]|nr:MAG: hypothetical protein LQ347_006406 [Umbilicaria vellea]